MNQIRATLRPSAVAGKFYPANPGEINTLLSELLDAASIKETSSKYGVPKALIVPHAGFRYSGEIAAAGYNQLRAVGARISRVVIVGPSHRVRVQGMAASGADWFETPLGRIPVDSHLIKQCARNFDFVNVHNAAHQAEHSLETQLPFLQRILRKFAIVPLAVGDADPKQVAQCLDYLWGGEETLILISSDLSHYHPYDHAKKLDRFTSSAIEDLHPQGITYEHACGQVGVRGLLMLAQQKKLISSTLDLRNSGDTFGSKEKVVGYGCYGFYISPPTINRRQRAELTRIANASIEFGLKNNQLRNPSLSGYGPLFTNPGASFITLSDSKGKLRGCIGSLNSNTALLKNVSDNAFKAAFNDRRFKPLSATEWAQTKLEVSVLGPPNRIIGDDEAQITSNIKPFVDGLIFQSQGRRGTFLPAVWKQIPVKLQFMQALKQKAGFDVDYWNDDVEVYRYSTETW